MSRRRITSRACNMVVYSKCSCIQVSIKETLYSSVLISSSIINNQQVIAQQQQQSPEEIQNEILRGNLDIEEGDGTTTTTTEEESSVQSLVEDNLLVYESPAYGIRTQYPDGWEIIIQSTSPSSISLRFNSPPENDTD